MSHFYIKFYKFVFMVTADKRLFERYFGDLIMESYDGIVDYYISYCGNIEKLAAEKYYSGRTVKNYMGTEYYLSEDGTGSAIRLGISVSGGEHLIEYKKNKICIYNIGECDNSIWCNRVCQDIIFIEMLKIGFIPVHASAVSNKNEGILIFGNKKDGKSTTMFSLVHQGFDIMSNDLVFLGKNDLDEWILVGWPWRITIGNGLLNKTKYKKIIDQQNEKTQFYPNEFCEIFHCKWCWSAKLTLILQPNISLDRKLEIEIIENVKAYELIKNKGIEYETTNCVLTGNEMQPRYEDTFRDVVKKYVIYQITGNIWKEKKRLYKKLLAKHMCVEQNGNT